MKARITFDLEIDRKDYMDKETTLPMLPEAIKDALAEKTKTGKLAVPKDGLVDIEIRD